MCAISWWWAKKTKEAALKQPGLSRAADIGPYTVFQIKDNPGSYAVPLKYKPVLVITKRWKELSLRVVQAGGFGSAAGL